MNNTSWNSNSCRIGGNVFDHYRACTNRDSIAYLNSLDDANIGTDINIIADGSGLSLIGAN